MKRAQIPIQNSPLPRLAALAAACLFLAGAHGQDAPPPGAAISFRASTPDLIAQDTTPPAAAMAPSRIPFHSATPRINSELNYEGGPPPPATYQDAPQPPMDQAAAGESQKEMGDLSSQKATIDSQIEYAESKLNAARKQLEVQSAAGNSDEADKWEQQVHDWDAQVNSLKSQEDEIDGELQAANQAQEIPPAAAPEDDVVVPGDNLEVYVVEDPTFNGRYQVRRGGYIIMPAVGRIPVAGKSMQGAEQEVRKALETSQLQHASVMVEKVTGQDIESGPLIFLSGAFRAGHPFRIPPGTKPTVVNVILSCGGVMPDADLTRVKVMRIVANKSVVEEENVEKILEGNGLTSDLTLSDGDVLLIPWGPNNNIFITGCVNRPGSQTFSTGLTALTAILNAGGFGRFADLKRVYVLRASPDGTKVRIPVNIVAIERGRVPDVPLAQGDIIIVPEKFFSL